VPYPSGRLRRLGPPAAWAAAVVVLLVGAAPAASAATHTAGRATTDATTMFTGQRDVVSATQVSTGGVGGTLDTISVFVGAVQAAPGNHLQVALYGDRADAPAELIARSARHTLQAGAWNAVAMPAAAVAAGTRYWLAFNVDGHVTQVPIANVAGGRTAWRYPVPFETWPSAFGAASLGPQAMQYSIFMTYRSGDAEPPPPPPDDGSPGCGTPVTPGAVTRTLTVGGVQRRYLVVVPPGLDASAPVPLIMGFHGGGGTAENARATYGLEGSEPAIHAYPQAAYWPEAGGVGWNVDPRGVDFPYVDALLDDVEARHCIATGRVFAAGKSNGGFFVNALACHRPALIRAIASVAGGGPGNGCNPPPTPAMIVHGARDMTVPLSSGEYSRELWLYVGGYAGAAPIPVDPAPCVAYPGTVEPVRWCRHDGGHDWPAWAGAGIRRFFLGLA